MRGRRTSGMFCRYLPKTDSEERFGTELELNHMPVWIQGTTRSLRSRRYAVQKMECPCDYIYDPAEGDHENNIDPGTAFADLPDDWVCPKCGAEKEYFYPVD